MEKKAISDYSDTELQSILKTKLFVVILFTIIEVLLATLSVIKLFNNKFNYATDLLPILFLPIFINIWKDYKTVKDELQRRKI